MNDTHRSTPAFAVAGKVDCPTALHTQTTAPDQGKGRESVTLWQEVRDLINIAWGSGEEWAVSRVLGILERRGFTEHADAPAADIGRDSGKSGAVASNGAEMGDHAPETLKTPVRADMRHGTLHLPEPHVPAAPWKGIPLAETDGAVLGIDRAIADGATSGITDAARTILAETIDRVGDALERQGDAIRDHLSGDHTPEQLDRDPSRWTPAGVAWLEAGAPVGVAYSEYRRGPIPVTHEMGTVTRDTLDPTAAEQRANLERIAGTPRPTAVEVKFILERLAEHERRFYALGYTGQAADCAMAATMLDRLGVEVLNLDLIVDDQQRQLARIAENAKPLDGLEVARLVQRARRVGEGLLRFDHNSTDKATGRLIEELVAALNDQARQVAAKPRGTVVTSPRFYGEEQRDAATTVAEEYASLAAHGAVDYADLADAVAYQLGMRRAEA